MFVRPNNRTKPMRGSNLRTEMQLGRQTLSQAVSAAVLERIRSGEFGPGDRLPTEKMLMEEYGVGRNSVREAVQALVTLGLVEVRPGRGATVIGIESENALDAETLSALLKEEAVDDLYAFRRLLEAETSACAALQCDRRRDRGDRPLRCARSSTPTRRALPVSAADDAFHAAIAAREPQQRLRDHARRGERADRQRPPADRARPLGRRRARSRSMLSCSRRSGHTIPTRPAPRCAATSTARSRRSTRGARSASRSSRPRADGANAGGVRGLAQPFDVADGVQPRRGTAYPGRSFDSPWRVGTWSGRSTPS